MADPSDGTVPTPPLVVRVLPDVAAIDKTFDYLVPDDLRGQVAVGDVVRIVLHGRRVGGWVVAVGVEPPPGVTLRHLATRSGDPTSGVAGQSVCVRGDLGGARRIK